MEDKGMNKVFRWTIITTFLIGIIFTRELIALAAPINVPGDQASIQAAINEASSGDIVLVAASGGPYFENINFNGKAITVRTTDGATINGGSSGSVVTFNSGEGLGSILDGFSLINGSGTLVEHGSTGHFYYHGGGILCDSSSPVIRN